MFFLKDSGHCPKILDCTLVAVIFAIGHLFISASSFNNTISATLFWNPFLLALKHHQHCLYPLILKFIWNVLFPPVLARVNSRCWKFSWRWHHHFWFHCQQVYWTQWDEAADQGIIQKKSVSGSQALPLVIFDKNVPFFPK